MTRLSFQDRSSMLFGREPDLAFLAERSARPGVTIVFGRPQMGKSWLLMELARRLAQPPPPSLLGRQTCLIGHFESPGEQADLLLHAIADLYSRWLADSDYFQQAEVLYRQRRGDLVSRFGETFGTVFEKLSKFGGKPLEAVGGPVKELFIGLAQANRDLQSGGIQLPRLQIVQGRDLLEIVHGITRLPLVLILDQWEKSPGLGTEANLVDTYLRHMDDWPPCHLFFASRPDPDPRAAARKLEATFPDDIQLYDLPPMHLQEDATAEALLDFIRSRVPFANSVKDGDLLRLINGYPRVVNRWTSPVSAPTLRSFQALVDLAENANRFLYPEFEELFPTLLETERRFAMRLALLPASSAPDVWSALRAVLQAGSGARDLDALKTKGVLELAATPTYGHPKRHEAALQYLLTYCHGELSEVCERLAIDLSQRIRDTSPSTVPFTEGLVQLQSVGPKLDLSPGVQALCACALSLMGEQPPSPLQYLPARVSLGTDLSRVAALLAMGLFNTLVDAKREGDLERRDGLLEELRTLARDFPVDAAVREWLAKGLYNTLNYAKQEDDLERRDGLLEELRTLARDFPLDAAVREQLAMGLFNTLNQAKREDDLERRDALLEELRTLARDFPVDAAVREWLAKGLYNTLNYAKQEDDLERRDGVLEELRTLARDFPLDAAVREELAMGLFNTLVDAKQEDDLERRDGLLEELRTLARDFPLDAAVREWLAKGLYNTLNYAKQEDDLERRDALLEELRELASRFPEEEIFKEIARRLDL